MFKKIIGSLLAVCMMVSVGSTVFASEVKGDYVEVASITEDLGDGTFTTTTLSIKSSNLARGFIGTRSAQVSKTVYNSYSGAIGGTIYLYADFFSDSAYDANVCYVGQHSYIVENYSSGLCDIKNVVESTKNNAGWFDKYAEYRADFTHSYNTYTVKDDVWVRCDSVGNTSSKSVSLAANEYVVGDTVITFG